MRPTMNPSLFAAEPSETEGNERHDAAKAQTEHQRHEEAGHAGSAFTRKPITERQLVGDEQFNGIEEDGVVD